VEQKETLVNRLSAVRKDRNKLLVEFLNELRPVLSQSYYMLTSNGGDVHARVDIHMENPEFPCEAGLYYNPTPPGKRFVYDLDQLSGG
jgi:chromosome segregation ATPase